MIDVPDRPDWMAEGRCSTGDAALLDLFFPSRGVDGRPAKQICARCPVLDQCREYALENGIHHGIWGGMSERQRRRERRRRIAEGEPVRISKPIEHGTRAGYIRCHKRPEGACGRCLDAAARYKSPDAPGFAQREDLYPHPRRRLDEVTV